MTIVGATMAILLAMSAVAFIVFPQGARVPMQWGIAGKPTWFLPKWAAVLWSPVLACGVMLFACVATGNKGADAMLTSIAAVIVFAHMLHLGLELWHFHTEGSGIR